MNKLQILNKAEGLVKDATRVTNDKTIDENTINKVVSNINDIGLYHFFENVKKGSFTYIDLVQLSNKITDFSDAINTIKDDVEFLEFKKKGGKFDFDKLDSIWHQRKFHIKYPKFKWKAYKDLIENPITELKNYKNQTVRYDPFVIDKFNRAIHQMFFDEMDIRIINTGKEGGGKTCLSSQQILYFTHFFSECGVIDYKVDIKKMFFSGLNSMSDFVETLKADDYFRVMALDEAEELSRANYRSEEATAYRSEMRRDRKYLRVHISNTPQIGELDLGLTLSRTNFIFYCTMTGNKKLGILNKGVVNMYIIPREDEVYSQYHKRLISYDEITISLSKNFSDKGSYYVGLPKSTIIKQFTFDNVWGFDKAKLDAHIKEENTKKKLAKDIKVTEYVAYVMFKFMPKLAEWGFDLEKKNEMKMYKTLNSWISNKLKKKFITDKKTFDKFEVLYSSNN